MTDNFVDDDYEVSGGRGGYMRFEAGSNKFRFLSKPLIGYEWWETEGGQVRKNSERTQKGDKPVRVHKDLNEITSPEAAQNCKEFWAAVVWNYKAKQVQILEITQKGILRTITTFAKDEEWGSPLGYDLQVFKTGEGLDTEYEVVPSPHKETPKEVLDQVKEMNINLEALITGDNPFGLSVPTTGGVQVVVKPAEGDLDPVDTFTS